MSHGQVQAEMQSLKTELVAAKAEVNVETPGSEHYVEQTNLQQKLSIQRENNRKLASEFEKLRLDMLQAHQEKEEELADLRAKVEVSRTIPMGKSAAAKA